MRICSIVLLIFYIFFFEAVHAESAYSSKEAEGSAGEMSIPILLEVHEANRVGWTTDSDDVGFLDFTLSMQYPIKYETFADCSMMPFFAFTGRFGQYLGTRNSSPVIGKKFNPKIFLRYFMNDVPASSKDQPGVDFIDIEYAHESNGQALTSPESLKYISADLKSSEYAKDFISRGWDYVGAAVQWHPMPQSHPKLVLGGSAKRYIGGFLQKNIEELYPWEGARDIAKISQVSGLQLVGKYTFEGNGITNSILRLDTGSSQPFRHVTISVELEVAKLTECFGVPFVLTYRNGYNSDLAQYYVKGSSIGFGFKFETIKDISRLSSFIPSSELIKRN